MWTGTRVARARLCSGAGRNSDEVCGWLESQGRNLAAMVVVFTTSDKKGLSRC
jgi:hypothetical protein